MSYHMQGTSYSNDERAALQLAYGAPAGTTGGKGKREASASSEERLAEPGRVSMEVPLS